MRKKLGKDPRPPIPRDLVDDVVATAKRLGEDVADQEPAIIIRTILRRYVDGAPLSSSGNKKSASARKTAKPPLRPAASLPTATAVTAEETLDLLRAQLLHVLRETVRADGLTAPLGHKRLAKMLAEDMSAGYAQTLVDELIARGEIKLSQAATGGPRGPRYKILTPL